MNVFINLWHRFSASSAGWTKTLVVEKLFKIWRNAFLFMFLQTKTFKLYQSLVIMLKTKLLFLFMLFIASPVLADTQQRLIVWMKNGDKVYFDLTEEPETTFGDGLLTIATSRTTAYYRLSNVQRYTYDGDITDVVDSKLRPNEVRFTQGTEQMTFEGLADGTMLEIFSLDGKKLSTVQAKGGARTMVSFSNYPNGTYIVKVGNANYKFLKR